MFARKMIVGMVAVVLVLTGGAAFGTTYHVASDGNDDANGLSWDTAFATVQKGLDDVNYGDEIWVAEGTYKPSNQTDPCDPRSAVFELITGVQVYGGFEGYETSRDQRDWQTNETTLSGDIGTTGVDTDNTYHVVYANDCDANTVINGFTVTKGYADADYPDYYGGGIYCCHGDLIIENCVITENSASKYLLGSGGGLFLWRKSPKVLNCRITNNKAEWLGGGVYCHKGTPIISGCTISGNEGNMVEETSAGGGIALWSSDANISDCIFTDNVVYTAGGAIIIRITMENEVCYAKIANCVFRGNFATYRGGAIINESSFNLPDDLTIKNCLFADNRVKRYGGAIYNYSSSPGITNCTFSGNSATGGWLSGQGGAIYNRYTSLYGGSSPVLKNCIFWGDVATDEGDEIYNQANCEPNISYCDIEGCGGSGGGWDPNLGNDYGGNIDVDPCFANVYDFLDETVANGTTTTISVADGNLYEVNDVIEYDYDGVVRTVNDVNTDSNTITFDTALDTNSVWGTRIHNWGPGATDLDEDYHLVGSGSPCIDGGDPNTDANNQTDLDGEPRLADGDGNGNLVVDMGADEYMLVYNLDACLGYVQIQDAIDDANGGDTIEVTEETYYEGIDFDGNAITVRSVDPNDWGVVEATIIDGNQANRVVTFKSSEDANSVLSGFTITNGKAPIDSSGYYPGNGIFCDGSSPKITNCIITDNAPNQTDSDGAIACYRGANPEISNCIIKDNTTDWSGGICVWNSSPTIKNSIIRNNSANYDGGGIYCYVNGDALITNCTISENTAENGGGLINYNSDPCLANCIFWGNEASVNGDEVYKVGIGQPTFYYSDVNGCGGSGPNDWDPNYGADGGGNIDEDPLYVNADLNDFHLEANSPCIDGGDPNGDYSGELDIDGQERVIGPSVDMGADEMVVVITDVNELQAMKDDLDMHYWLGNDIDASATSGWNGGSGFEPVGTEANSFTGTFDGRGHTITSLYIDRPNEGHVGLFGLTMYAVIKDVNVADANVTGLGGTGILVGSGRHSKVDRCCSSGTLKGTASNQGPIGGLMGSSIWANTVVSRCHSSADVTAIGAYPTTNRSGGLVGLNNKGSIIIDCYATGDVSGKRKIGGLVGDNTWGSYGGYIKRCYSVGEVTATGGLGGGLVGYNYQGGVTYDSYWDVNTSGWETSYGGTGKTTTEMMDVNTFEDWDFVNVWDINDGNSYPYLRE